MPNPKPPVKKAAKRGRDETRTARGVAHLTRLAEAKGKRLVVDLNEPAREALEALQAAGYGAEKAGVIPSQAAVVRLALVEVAKRKAKKAA